MGASLGAYHAANTLLKHPDVFKRCFALSGCTTSERFMDGVYDDNFYFNNPVDYVASLSNGDDLHQLRSCDIHLATGNGPYEDSGPSYRLAGVLLRAASATRSTTGARTAVTTGRSGSARWTCIWEGSSRAEHD